jgi:FtsH-binding integral membrane protein
MSKPYPVFARHLDYSFNSFLNQVFIWMGLGMVLTALVAYLFATNPYLYTLLSSPEGITPLGYVVMFAPLGFVLLMSIGFKRFSYIGLLSLFLIYSAIMGASLSFIFIIYAKQSIYWVFILASSLFGGMGALGYFTSIDLSKIGNLALMALIGIIVASLVNFFLKSNTFAYLISIGCVFVFSLLTAWDLQKLKRLNEEARMNEINKSKLAVLGALTLYLDFINLFLSLLRIFGSKKGR